jgi:hypothetical protein
MTMRSKGTAQDRTVHNKTMPDLKAKNPAPPPKSELNTCRRTRCRR